MNENTESVDVGDVVQLSPTETKNDAFAGCMLVVTDVYSWGVQGYVQSLGASRDAVGGQAHYRAEKGTYAFVGKAVWRTD